MIDRRDAQSEESSPRDGPRGTSPIKEIYDRWLAKQHPTDRCQVCNERYGDDGLCPYTRELDHYTALEGES